MTGNQPVAITSIVLTGANAADFAISANNCITPAGFSGTCSFNVAFAPTAAGPRTAAITITDNATGSPQSVSLSGTGQIVSTTLTINPTSLTFSAQNLNTPSSQQGFNITNTGTTAINFTSIALSGTNAADFALAGNNCGNSLPVGSYCTVYITFTPTAIGSRIAAVSLTDNATGSPQSVTLSGTGQAVTTTLTLTPNALAFNGQNLNTTSSPLSFSIGNTGTTAVNFTSIALTGANAADFAIASSNCGNSLAVGSYCPVYVTFTPKALGPRTAAVTITDNATGSPQSVPLSGTGQTNTTTNINPASVIFGVSNVAAAATQTLTITNTGNPSAFFSAFTIGGTNAADFAITANTCPTGASPLASGSGCTLSISMTPSAAGPRSANLTITDNTAQSPQVIFLGGTGATPTTTLAFNPLVLPFNSLNVASTSSASNITVTNTGNTTVNFSSIAITGTNKSNFAIVSTGAGDCAGSRVQQRLAPPHKLHCKCYLHPLRCGPAQCIARLH